MALSRLHAMPIYAHDVAGGSDVATVARAYGTAFNGTPAISPHAQTATGTATAFDASVEVVESGPITKPTLAPYELTLRWTRPVGPDGFTMLAIWRGDDFLTGGLNEGDEFGLLMELADDPGVLPGWDDDEDD